ncbi:MAG TPA: GTP cyclohydrolase I [Polyangiaceae bacterium]|jgi:GTP cyclohydrolase I|nr:GTP cyclohydrolase I [Polyangiaceae bacterium]
MPVDRTRAEKAVFEFLRAIGQDPDGDPELAATPARVAEAWATDLIDGYDVDVPGLLAGESSPAPGEATGIITVRGLAVSTMCPHHLLPARGTATVLYWPGERIAGIGTLARLVDAYAHRLALQEAIGAKVASALVEHLGARGAACKIALSHSCLASRGERQTAATVETLALAGTFGAAGPDRDLALAALGEPA